MEGESTTSCSSGFGQEAGKRIDKRMNCTYVDRPDSVGAGGTNTTGNIAQRCFLMLRTVRY